MSYRPKEKNRKEKVDIQGPTSNPSKYPCKSSSIVSKAKFPTNAVKGGLVGKGNSSLP
jgi:hypothetical protein